jgi:hypothetical protein
MSLSLAELKNRGLFITRDEVANGELDPLTREGLVGIALCNYSTGRSLGAAEILTCARFPTAYLQGGLWGLAEADRIQLIQVINFLQRVPHLMVFLTNAEKKDYFPILTKLGKVEYYNSPGGAYDALRTA